MTPLRKFGASLPCITFIILWISSVSLASETYEPMVQEIAKEFPLTVLSQEELLNELQWFRDIAQPIAKRLNGAQIRSCAEPIPVHIFERDTLAPLFEKLTGIRIQHDIIHEGEVVNHFSEQISTGRRLYHVYVLDADNIGLVTRSDRVVNLTEFMKNEGKDVTSPRIDLADFLNIEVAQDYTGDLYQLPDQSFPILYWYRTDWFSDLKARSDFKAKYDRELDVPKTWEEYEQIAEFFTGRKMMNPDGTTVTAYGHLDYYRVGDVSLGWRIADVQLGNAGVGSKGLPNGLPVDEYGIRVENGIPVGASVERGGALDSPAAVYALEKYIDWLRYAPPRAKDMDWADMAKELAEGNIAQTIYFCSVFIYFNDKYTTPGPIVTPEGKPVWKMVPQPRGKYWQEGMKIGYKDIGSHTIPKNVRNDYRLAAWLWAQFCTSKITSLAKFQIGVTPIRRSTLQHEWTQKNAYKWGGLVEFYLSDMQKLFTDTGLNVPHYPAIAALWYRYVSMVVEGMPIQEAMTKLAYAVDDIMEKVELPKMSPQLNHRKSREYWLKKEGAPKPEIR